MDLAQETDLHWQIPMFEQLDAAKRKRQALTAEITAGKDDEIPFHMDEESGYQPSATSLLLCIQRHPGSFSV